MHARRLVRPVGGFAVLALALAACTSSSPEPAPTTSAAPVEIDLRTEFPDAITEGVVTPVSTDVDAGSGTVQADGTVLLTGSSDGVTDDSIGILDLTTGDVEWLVEDTVPEAVTLVAGQLTPEVLTWTVEVEAVDEQELAATLEDVGGYVFALDRASGKRTVLADASGAGGMPPGTYAASVAVQDGIAYWEGLDGDDLSTIYSRPLDGSGAPAVVATDAWGVAADPCVSAGKLSFFAFAEDDVTRRLVNGDGTAGETVAIPAPTAADRIVEIQCGTAYVQSPYSEDGGVSPDDYDTGEEGVDDGLSEDDETAEGEPLEGEVVVEGENLSTEGDASAADPAGDLIELVDGASLVRFRANGVGRISSVALDATWMTLGLAVGDDDSDSRQLLFHRASGKVYELPQTSMTMLDLQNGYVTYGSTATEDSDSMTVVGKLTAP